MRETKPNPSQNNVTKEIIIFQEIIRVMHFDPKIDPTAKKINGTHKFFQYLWGGEGNNSIPFIHNMQEKRDLSRV